MGEKGRRIRELTELVRKRFRFPENSLEMYAEKVQYRGLSAIAQCESLRYKLLNGLAVRRWCWCLFGRVLITERPLLGLAMVSFDLLWNPVPRGARLLSPESFVPPVPSP